MKRIEVDWNNSTYEEGRWLVRGHVNRVEGGVLHAGDDIFVYESGDGIGGMAKVVRVNDRGIAYLAVDYESVQDMPSDDV